MRECLIPVAMVRSSRLLRPSDKPCRVQERHGPTNPSDKTSVGLCRARPPQSAPLDCAGPSRPVCSTGLCRARLPQSASQIGMLHFVPVSGSETTRSVSGSETTPSGSETTRSVSGSETTPPVSGSETTPPVSGLSFYCFINLLQF